MDNQLLVAPSSHPSPSPSHRHDQHEIHQTEDKKVPKKLKRKKKLKKNKKRKKKEKIRDIIDKRECETPEVVTSVRNDGVDDGDDKNGKSSVNHQKVTTKKRKRKLQQQEEGGEEENVTCENDNDAHNDTTTIIDHDNTISTAQKKKTTTKQRNKKSAKKKKKNKRRKVSPEEKEEEKKKEGESNNITQQQQQILNQMKTTKKKQNNLQESNVEDKKGKDHQRTVIDASGINGVTSFPFETDADDHCESPIEAYNDILPILRACAKQAKKSNDQLAIYDPYYCDHRVARNLSSLGFSNVYNQKEDCYQIWNDRSLYPSNDILVTNPPYSGDHIEKLIRHVTEHAQQSKKPFALLLPVFVHKKDYYERITNKKSSMARPSPSRGHQQRQHHQQQRQDQQQFSPIYLVPHKRYIYQPPPKFREKKISDTHKKSSPFPSMWYLWGGSMETTNEWYQILHRQSSSSSQGGYSIARSKSGLRDLRRKHKK